MRLYQCDLCGFDAEKVWQLPSGVKGHVDCIAAYKREQNMNFKQEEEDYNKEIEKDKDECRDGAILALFTSEELTEEIMRRLRCLQKE